MGQLPVIRHQCSITNRGSFSRWNVSYEIIIKVCRYRKSLYSGKLFRFPFRHNRVGLCILQIGSPSRAHMHKISTKSKISRYQLLSCSFFCMQKNSPLSLFNSSYSLLLFKSEIFFIQNLVNEHAVKHQ